MSKKIENKVDNYLQEWGVKYSATHLCANDHDEWPHDLFMVYFTKGKNSFHTEYKTGTGHRVKNRRGQIVATLPNAASTLYCLVSDAEFGSYPFEDFCDSLGYSSDSISAFNIYRQCEQNAKGMRKVFTAEQIKILTEILQDY